MALETIAERARALREVYERKLDLEEELKQANKLIKEMSESVAEAMMNEDCSEFKFADGTKLTYKLEWRASIKNPGRDGGVNPDAVAWLEDNGFGGVLREDVIVHFPRGERDPAARETLRKMLNERGYAYDEEIDVPWNTLAALVRDLAAEGREVPEVLRPTTYYSVRFR